MRGFNKATIMGNVSKDPELKHTSTKKAFVRFAVAVNRSHNKEDGVDFINVIAWEKTAEICAQYLKKGSGVLIHGRIQVSSYDAKDGSGKRYTTDIVASDVQFIGGKENKVEDEEGIKNKIPAAAGAGGDDVGTVTLEIPF